MSTDPVGPVEVCYYWPEAILRIFYWPGASGSLALHLFLRISSDYYTMTTEWSGVTDMAKFNVAGPAELTSGTYCK